MPVLRFGDVGGGVAMDGGPPRDYYKEAAHAGDEGMATREAELAGLAAATEAEEERAGGRQQQGGKQALRAARVHMRPFGRGHGAPPEEQVNFQMQPCAAAASPLLPPSTLLFRALQP